MIAFIDDHREAYGVEPICRLLPIASSTYHAHVARRADPGKLPARARSDAALMVEIRRLFEANLCVHGMRKVWRQLDRDGITVARCTVARPLRSAQSSTPTTCGRSTAGNGTLRIVRSKVVALVGMAKCANSRTAGWPPSVRPVRTCAWTSRRVR